MVKKKEEPVMMNDLFGGINIAKSAQLDRFKKLAMEALQSDNVRGILIFVANSDGMVTKTACTNDITGKMIAEYIYMKMAQP